MRNDARRRVADAGMHGRMFVRRRFVRLVLKVVRDDDAGDGALGERDAKRAIDQVLDLPGHHRGLHELRRDILEKILQIDFLLIRTAHREPRRLPDDRNDRLMIEFGVV